MADPATTQDVFTSDQSSEPQQSREHAQEPEEKSQQQPMQVPQEVSDLVGEGKKYRDVNSALNSIKPAQEHIQKLENDNKELREKVQQLESDLQARESVQSVLDKLGKTGDSEQQNSLDPESVKQLVYGALEERETVTTAKQNVQTVNDKLVSTFGEKAREVVAQKASDLGMSVNDLQQLAARSPKAVLAYFDVKENKEANVRPAQTNPSALDSSKTTPTGGRSWKEITQELKEKHNITG